MIETQVRSAACGARRPEGAASNFSPSRGVRLPMRQQGHIADRLGAWLAGTLPEAQAAEVRRHLDSCAVCAEERDLLREGISIAPPLPAFEARPGFAARAAACAGEGRRHALG